MLSWFFACQVILAIFMSDAEWTVWILFFPLNSTEWSFSLFVYSRQLTQLNSNYSPCLPRKEQELIYKSTLLAWPGLWESWGSGRNANQEGSHLPSHQGSGLPGFLASPPYFASGYSCPFLHLALQAPRQQACSRVLVVPRGTKLGIAVKTGRSTFPSSRCVLPPMSPSTYSPSGSECYFGTGSLILCLNRVCTCGGISFPGAYLAIPSWLYWLTGRLLVIL